eukprot:TRINITY_DN26956_c0_g1_i1.p2 TRINITY_DN26956_c0_g1~~TRINITY_DN26956_c0_g1_i1.p2  ORF type:complete len:689 (+),score=213.54 TRINITY_DN26956_c0_g1_i1:358-2424(+)
MLSAAVADMLAAAERPPALAGLAGAAQPLRPPPAARGRLKVQRRRPPLPPPIPPALQPAGAAIPAAEAPAGLLSPPTCPTPGAIPADLALGPPALPERRGLPGGAPPEAAAVLHGFPGRFPLADETGWKGFLRLHGWAVVGGVASPEEVERLTSGFWDYREQQGGGISRSDPTTWGNDRWGGNLQTGQWQGEGAGQEQWVWDARAVMATVFESIYKTDRLLTSFEGFCTFRPGLSTRSGCWHVDQALDHPDFESFQSFLSLADSTETDGGLCVVPGSKKLFADGALSALPGMTHSRTPPFHIPKGSIETVVCDPVKVNCQAGDVVIWDARTIHCSQPGTDLKPRHHPALTRLCVYASMVPVSVAARHDGDRRALSERQSQRRRSMIEEGRTSTHHWSCRQAPHARQGAQKPPPGLEQWVPPLLTPRLLRLAGLARYDGPERPELPYSREPRDIRELPRIRSPAARHAEPPPAPAGGEPAEPVDPMALIDESCARHAQRLAAAFCASLNSATGGGPQREAACAEAARHCARHAWVLAQRQVQERCAGGGGVLPLLQVLRKVDELCRLKVRSLALNAERNAGIAQQLLAARAESEAAGTAAAEELARRVFEDAQSLAADGGGAAQRAREEYFADRTVDPAQGRQVEKGEQCKHCEERDCVYYYVIETGGVGKPKPTGMRGCIKCGQQEQC